MELCNARAPWDRAGTQERGTAGKWSRAGTTASPPTVPAPRRGAPPPHCPGLRRRLHQDPPAPLLWSVPKSHPARREAARMEQVALWRMEPRGHRVWRPPPFRPSSGLSAPAGHSRQSSSSLLSEQSLSSSHLHTKGMQRSFRHRNWSFVHSWIGSAGGEEDRERRRLPPVLPTTQPWARRNPLGRRKAMPKTQGFTHPRSRKRVGCHGFLGYWATWWHGETRHIRTAGVTRLGYTLHSDTAAHLAHSQIHADTAHTEPLHTRDPCTGRTGSAPSASATLFRAQGSPETHCQEGSCWAPLMVATERQ